MPTAFELERLRAQTSADCALNRCNYLQSHNRSHTQKDALVIELHKLLDKHNRNHEYREACNAEEIGTHKLQLCENAKKSKVKKIKLIQGQAKLRFETKERP